MNVFVSRNPFWDILAGWAEKDHCLSLPGPCKLDYRYLHQRLWLSSGWPGCIPLPAGACISTPSSSQSITRCSCSGWIPVSVAGRFWNIFIWFFLLFKKGSDIHVGFQKSRAKATAGVDWLFLTVTMATRSHICQHCDSCSDNLTHTEVVLQLRPVHNRKSCIIICTHYVCILLYMIFTIFQHKIWEGSAFLSLHYPPPMGWLTEWVVVADVVVDGTVFKRCFFVSGKGATWQCIYEHKMHAP